ncbi:MAG: PorP/SprF family type IX secretion system membrane protein [Chitinophagales bacterium]
MRNKKFVVLFFAVLTVLGLKAQDPHFSQYSMMPIYLNPAMTGVYSGNYRVNALYRSQWQSVLKDESTPMFRTFGASADFRFQVGKNDAVGAGLMFINDRAGAGDFGTNQGNISVSYIKSLNYQANNFLTAGFIGGVGQRSVNYQSLRFGNQFDGEGYNPLLNSGEVLGENFTFFDLGVGVFWYYIKDKRRNYYAGVSVNHLNRPNMSFYDGEDSRLYMKINFNAGVQLPLGNQLDLLPSVLFMNQGPAIETMLGTYFKIFFNSAEPGGNAFYVGPYYRMVGGEEKAIASEALVLATRVDYSSFTIGFSYDLNFSELTAASNSRGGFEVSLMHIGSWSKKNKTLFCPRF